MKTKFRSSILLLLAAVFTAGMIASCSDDGDSTPPADKTALQASITAANTLLTASVEGSAEGQYQTGAKAALQAAVTASQVVVNDNTVIQTEVDNANVALNAAVDLFKTKVVSPIAPESLVAQWKFDEGTGTVANDASANKFNGTLTVGHSSLKGGIPTWSADRKSAAGKSLHFTLGGHIEVPSNANFNPTELTIALWVNADKIYNDNYMLAQNSYKGYKFQLQEANKPFLTVSYGVDQYINKDTENGIGSGGLPVKEWHHVATSFKNGEMNFYVDGVLVKSWTDNDVKHTPVTLSDRFDFVIGQELPNAKVDPGINYTLPHFEGFMDEVRFYKKALTSAQIQGIYNQEK